MKNLLLLLTSIFTLIACDEKINDNRPLPVDDPEYDFKNACIINDAARQTCASAVQIAYNPYLGVAFAVYLTSNTGYGEQRDEIALAVFDPYQPQKVKTFTVVKTGDVSNNFKMNAPFEPNIFLLNNKTVRITFFDKSMWNYYIDFDYGTESFSLINQMPVNIPSGTQKYMGTGAYQQMLSYLGLPMSNMIMSQYGAAVVSPYISVSGERYSVVSSLKACPVIIKFIDDKTVAPVFGLPYMTEFECFMCYFEGEFHFLARNYNGTYGISYFKTSDHGKTFTEPIVLTNSIDSRPFMKTYKNKLLIVYSAKSGIVSDEPKPARDKLIFKYGTGNNPNEYKTVIEAYNYHGLVYPYLIETADNNLFMAFSSSFLGFEKTQGKDCIQFINLGIIQ